MTRKILLGHVKVSSISLSKNSFFLLQYSLENSCQSAWIVSLAVLPAVEARQPVNARDPGTSQDVRSGSKFKRRGTITSVPFTSWPFEFVVKLFNVW